MMVCNDYEMEEANMLLTVKDLQELLKVGRDTAYSLMRATNFPSMKLGGRYYVTREALQKWLERSEYKQIIL